MFGNSCFYYVLGVPDINMRIKKKTYHHWKRTRHGKSYVRLGVMIVLPLGNNLTGNINRHHALQVWQDQHASGLDGSYTLHPRLRNTSRRGGGVGVLNKNLINHGCNMWSWNNFIWIHGSSHHNKLNNNSPLCYNLVLMIIMTISRNCHVLMVILLYLATIILIDWIQMGLNIIDFIIFSKLLDWFNIYVLKHTEVMIYLTILSPERTVTLHQTLPSLISFLITWYPTLHCNPYAVTLSENMNQSCQSPSMNKGWWINRRPG